MRRGALAPLCQGLLAASLSFCVGGCHRASPQAASAPASDADAGAAEPIAPPIVGPARCRATEWGARLGDDGGGADLELGDAILVGDAVAVALVHRSGGERVAALAFVRPAEDAPPRIIDLGPTLGDAPPPRIASRGTGVVSAFHPTAKEKGGRAGGERGDLARTLAVRSVSPDGASPLFSLDVQRDDSLASDVTVAGESGIVVWDEATSEPRGVIRGASFAVGTGQRTGALFDLSPKDSDAEAPLAVAYGNGFAVAWIARGPDPDTPAVDGSDLEVPGEVRSRGWVELALVDERGVATAPVRRLTPAGGHVTAFDMTTAAVARAGRGTDANALPTLLVAARDEGEALDGSGGTLLRVRVGPDGAQPPVALTTDGLGRGAPIFVEGSTPWLSWAGPREQLRVLALDSDGAPSGLPSAEDAMEDERPVLALPSGDLLVEAPGDAARPLRTFDCGARAGKLPSRHPFE